MLRVNVVNVTPDTKSVETNRIESVDFLRGIASLMVCYTHTTVVLPSGFLHSSGKYGWLGVDIFFVISGFVIPYSLHKASYGLRDFGNFLLRRVTRVDPPYFVSIIFAVICTYICSLSPSWNGGGFSITLQQVALHLFYLNAFFKQDWVNDVYWTLAIEFQYYLMIGLLYPLLTCKNITRYIIFAALAVVSIVCASPDFKPFVVHWLFLFMIGILVFWNIAKSNNGKSFWVILLLLSLGSYFTLGLLITITGVLSALVILWFKKPDRFFLFLGKISYSLYLTHEFTGRKIISLGVRFFPGPLGQLFLLIVGLGASLSVAWLLYEFVERPAVLWSHKFSYQKQCV